MAAGDNHPLDTGRIADFIAGVAWDAAAESGHVALALCAAAREAAGAGEGALMAAHGVTPQGLEVAGHDCATALVSVLDALEPEGEAAVAAGCTASAPPWALRPGRQRGGRWRHAHCWTQLRGGSRAAPPPPPRQPPTQGGSRPQHSGEARRRGRGPTRR
eukprot:1927298-Pleurochrysis_carterae.AAC.2